MINKNNKNIKEIESLKNKNKNISLEVQMLQSTYKIKIRNKSYIKRRKI